MVCWAKTELNVLETFGSTETAIELSHRLPNRSVDAINVQRQRMGINPPPRVYKKGVGRISAAHYCPEILGWWDEHRNPDSPHDLPYGCRKTRWFKCPKCLSIFERFLFDFCIEGRRCPYCSGRAVNHTNSIHTTHPKIADTLVDQNLRHLLTAYCGRQTEWQCDKCPGRWSSEVYNRTLHGCPYCCNQKIGYWNCVGATHPEIADELVDQSLRNKISATGSRKCLFECSKCQKRWTTKICMRCRKDGRLGTGCPRCRESRGERRIAYLLTKMGIEFEREKTFSELIYFAPLKLDFYVRQLGMAIEFHGEQHFREVKFSTKWTEQEARLHYLEVKIRDDVKRNYCQTHGIRLIEIPYWDFDKIEMILHNVLALANTK